MLVVFKWYKYGYILTTQQVIGPGLCKTLLTDGGNASVLQHRRITYEIALKEKKFS